MWTDHYLAAKKCLALYEAAMNAREWDVAQLQAQAVQKHARIMAELTEQERANQQG